MTKTIGSRLELQWDRWDHKGESHVHMIRLDWIDSLLALEARGASAFLKQLQGDHLCVESNWSSYRSGWVDPIETAKRLPEHRSNDETAAMSIEIGIP